MKDFFGQELHIGDVVAFPAPSYRNLTLGTISRFTKQKVILDYVNTWNFKKPGVPLTFKADPGQCIKRSVSIEQRQTTEAFSVQSSQSESTSENCEIL